MSVFHKKNNYLGVIVIWATAALLVIVTQNSFSSSSINDNSLFDLSLEELMDYKITSVMRREESISESPSAIQVITKEQIKLAGVSSLPEALRLATNLQVARQNANQWIISARGFSSDAGNKLLVLIDGRSVYTPLLSGVFWDRQNYLLEDIDRIEVISGPGGTLWGANAVNGVINIITRSANDTKGFFIEASAGSQLKKQFGIRFGDSVGDTIDYRLYGTFSERDNEYLGDGSTGNDAWETAQLGFRLDSKLSQTDTLTLQGDYFGNKAATVTQNENTTKGGNILSRWTHELSSDSNLQLQMYFDKTSLELYVAPFVAGGVEIAPEGILENDLETFDLDFQYNLGWKGSHNLIWGFSYRKTDDQTSNAPGLGFLPEDLRQELYSIFIQGEISVIPDELDIILGTKVESNDYTGTEWEPNVRLKWALDEEKLFWAAISRAVRMPSRVDTDLVQPSPPYFTVLAGDPDFVSENVIAYELGYRAQINNKLIASMAGFYNEYKDIRSTNFTPDTLFPLVFENNVEGKNWGIELNASLQLTQWWRIKTGYNLIENKMQVKKGEVDINNALNETADPKHQISINSSIIHNNIEFNLGLRWVDKLPVDEDGEKVYIDSYSELDMRLGWHARENIELSIIGQNLLHDRHQEFGNPGSQFQEIGRNIFLKFQLRY